MTVSRAQMSAHRGDVFWGFPRTNYSSRSEFIISSREARAQCVNRACVLASCKLAALIFTCIYPMVSAMTSYSSWRHGAFLFLGNIRLKAISNSHQWPKHSWRAVFSSSAKQCLLSVNLKPFLMQTEQQTQERRIVNPRRGRFDTEKSSGAKNAALKFNGASNKDGWRRQQKRSSFNEFQMLKFFKSKWKRFWIFSLINIWENIAVTKHVLLE